MILHISNNEYDYHTLLKGARMAGLAGIVGFHESEDGYTDKAKGVLTEQRFMKLTAALEQEQEANQKRLHDLAVMQSRADAQESEVRTFIKEIRRYAAIEELDESVLNRLISKILIGEVKKVDGQKVQEVRIVYNFVGEIPEIAAQIVCPISHFGGMGLLLWIK